MSCDTACCWRLYCSVTNLCWISLNFRFIYCKLQWAGAHPTRETDIFTDALHWSHGKDAVWGVRASITACWLRRYSIVSVLFACCTWQKSIIQPTRFLFGQKNWPTSSVTAFLGLVSFAPLSSVVLFILSHTNGSSGIVRASTKSCSDYRRP